MHDEAVEFYAHSISKIFKNLSHGDFAFRSLLLSPSSLPVAFSVAWR